MQGLIIILIILIVILISIIIYIYIKKYINKYLIGFIILFIIGIIFTSLEINNINTKNDEIDESNKKNKNIIDAKNKKLVEKYNLIDTLISPYNKIISGLILKDFINNINNIEVLEN